MTQLIPNVIWISMCVNYQAKYSNSMFVKGTLKDRMHDVLKELKIGNSNEGSERAMF
jgi:hypothetical protein